MTERKTYNEELRQRLEDFQKNGRARPLSNSELGAQLGYDGTVVSRYLSFKNPKSRGYTGDVDGLEKKIADMLKAAARRRELDLTRFETNVTRGICSCIEQARKTNDVSLITGPAGIGKTVAIALYVAEHPTAISVTATRWHRDDRALVAMIFDAIENRAWSGQTPRADFVIEHLRGSSRPVVIDGAHRLTRSALAGALDFHDATDCPLVFVGNPEIEAAFRASDQNFSRIGCPHHFELSKGELAEYAQKMVDALVSDPDPALYALAATVAANQGHLRAVRKELVLAMDVVTNERFAGDQVKAMHYAHKKLLRDYEL